MVKVRGKSLRAILIVLTLFVALVLSACAQNAAPSEPTAEPESEPAAETESETAEEAPAEESEAESAEAPSGEPVELGVVLNLTTGFASYGTPMMNGVQLAVDHKNAAGGINGRPIEIVSEDAADTPTTAVNAINKVLEQEPLAIVGPILGFQMIPFREIVDEEQVPIISLSGTRGWTMNDNKYAFRTAEFDGNAKPALTDFVVNELGAESIGIIVVANEWGFSGRDHVTAWLRQKYDMEPTLVETYQTTDTDMSAQLINLRDAGVDVIISQGHPPDTATIMKQMKQLGIDIPLVTSSVADTAINLDITEPEDVEGVYVQTYALPWNNPDPEIAAWAQEYNERFNMIPDAYSLAQYDGVMALFAAMEAADEAGNLTPQGVTDAMWELEYEGLITTYKADHEGNMMKDYIVVHYGPNKQGEIVYETTVPVEETLYELPES